MAIIFSIFLVHSLTLLGGGAVVAAADCIVRRCKQDGPIIRFPFWLEGPHNQQQPDECTYRPAGFELSCNPSNNDTELELQYLANTSRPEQQVLYSLKASVMSINYTSRQINLSPSEFIPIQQLSPIHIPDPYFLNSLLRTRPYFFHREISFFNCSETNTEIYGFAYGRLAGDNGLDQVFMIDSRTPTSEVPLTSCTKMYNVSHVVDLYDLQHKRFYPLYLDHELFWSRPYCGDCEAKGKYCKLENHSINTGNKHDSTTLCFAKVDVPSYESVPVLDVPVPAPPSPYKPVVPGIVGGVLFLVMLVLVALYYVVKTYYKQKKKEHQLKIKSFLADYKALKPTRYSYADIRKMTNQFKEKLGQV